MDVRSEMRVSQLCLEQPDLALRCSLWMISNPDRCQVTRDRMHDGHMLITSDGNPTGGLTMSLIIIINSEES